MKKIVILLVIAILAIVFSRTTSKVKVIDHNKLHSNMAAIDEPAKSPSTAQIYIDASGSMKGYFISDKPDFNNVMGYLWGYAGNQKVFFVGQGSPYTGIVANLLSNLKAQPNNTASPLDYLIPDLCRKSDNRDICFLVTDGIQSIGRGNMQMALEQYKQRLKQTLGTFAGNKAIAVLKYSAEFKSDPGRRIFYFDMHDAPKAINVIKRPYYVIAVGDKAVIRDLKEHASAKLMPEEQIYFGIHDYKGHNANKQQEAPTLKLENPNKDITLSATLPKCIQNVDNDYICENSCIFQNGIKKDATVIYTGGSLKVNVNPTTAPAMVPDTGGYVNYDVKVRNVIPLRWTNLSSNDDRNIQINASEKTKTFSLKYLLEAIKEAFDHEENLIEIKYKFKY